jgi:hypothetical protein
MKEWFNKDQNLETDGRQGFHRNITKFFLQFRTKKNVKEMKETFSNNSYDIFETKEQKAENEGIFKI